MFCVIYPSNGGLNLPLFIKWLGLVPLTCVISLRDWYWLLTISSTEVNTLPRIDSTGAQKGLISQSTFSHQSNNNNHSETNTKLLYLGNRKQCSKAGDRGNKMADSSLMKMNLKDSNVPIKQLVMCINEFIRAIK